MQTIVYHSKARKTMCGMGTFCLIGMISFQLTMQNGESFIVRNGIRGNDDLNNIVAPGYYQLSSSAANSVANPAFRNTSIVEVITTDSYIVQRQTGPSESKYRFRDSNSNWGAWL